MMTYVEQQADHNQETNYFQVVNSTIQLLVTELIRVRKNSKGNEASAFVSRFNSKLEVFSKVIKYMEANQKSYDSIAAILEPLVEFNKTYRSTTVSNEKLGSCNSSACLSPKIPKQVSEPSKARKIDTHRTSFCGDFSSSNLLEDINEDEFIPNTKQMVLKQNKS